MTQISIYGGPPKSALIEMAYEMCGQAGEYALDGTEVSSALRRLDSLMNRLVGEGCVLGYNFPPDGSVGSGADESGIPFDAQEAVSGLLAKSIAALTGKQLSPAANRQIASAESTMRANYMVIPTMAYRSDTIRGQGRSRVGWWSPYYPGSN